MKTRNNHSLLLVCGASAAGALALVWAASKKPGQPKGHRMDWIARVMARVHRHEGGYDSLNRNTDGAGLSFGILQWAQKPGSLGTLLTAMQHADPTEFARIFGPSWQRLIAVTRAGSLDPVDGEALWKRPWTTRFKQAGRHEVFRAVQRRMAREGIHFRGAVEAARILGVATERSMALFFDTAVQQGPGAAKKVARQVRDRFAQAGRTSVPYSELLADYAQRAADRCRTLTQPSRPPRSSHLRWVQVGREWHLFAQKIDLYEDIWRRRMSIVNDDGLSDDAVALE